MSGKSVRRNWTRVSLRLSSETVPPEQITQVAGLEPSRQYRKGDHFGNNPRYPQAKSTVWSLNSGATGNVPAETQLELLLTAVEPAWAELKALGVQAQFYCTLNPDPHQDGFSLHHDLLRRLAGMPADLEITILSPPEDSPAPLRVHNRQE